MPPIMIAGIVLIVVILIVALCLLGYVKAPPDQAYIISGFRKHRTLIGKAGVRIPVLERLDKLSLALIPIDVKTSSAVPTADYINISVDAAVNVKISDDMDKLKLASANFLNQPTDYIARVAREVLEGNMREIVGKMRLEEMVSDRQKFANLVKENAEPDLASMGLDIISFNVQNFVDGNGVIENLGVDNIVRIQRGAAISRAESERDIKIAQATAQREANDARVEAETQMAERNNALAIRQAELKQQADRKQAEADAAYSIQEQEQRRSIEVASANADIARAERTAELKAREVDVAKQTLDAEIRAKADAERYAAEQEAEAELFRRTKEAEAKMTELNEAFDALMGSGEGMEFQKTIYIVAVEYPSVVRMDVAAWVRNTRAQGIRDKCKSAIAVVAVKSAVDITKLDFATFVSVYAPLLSKCYSSDLKNVDELLDSAENIYKRRGLQTKPQGLQAIKPYSLEKLQSTTISMVPQVGDF